MANSVFDPLALDPPAPGPSADAEGLIARLVPDELAETAVDPAVTPVVAAFSLSNPRLSACSPRDIFPVGLRGCVGGNGEWVEVGEPQLGLTGMKEVVCGELGRWRAMAQSGSSQCQMAVRWRRWVDEGGERGRVIVDARGRVNCEGDGVGFKWVSHLDASKKKRRCQTGLLMSVPANRQLSGDCD